MRFADGRKRRIHFFASRLKYSRFAAVTIVPNEQVETLVRTLVRHFTSFGGVPLLAVFDRPRTIVAKSGRGREVEELNATFAQVMLELGAEMCAPRSGTRKGSVEHLVKWVKSSFFKWRKLADEAVELALRGGDRRPAALVPAEHLGVSALDVEVVPPGGSASTPRSRPGCRAVG